MDNFRRQMAEHGLDPGDIVSDGAIHRFPTWGDVTGETSGAYWHNGKFGWFQDWRTMEKPQVVSGELSESDKKALGASFDGASNKVSMDTLLKSARRIWDNAVDPNSHPYLVKKQISPPAQVRRHDGCLVVPLFGMDGQWNGLQRIDAGGRKRFLTGTRKKGSFFTIQGDDTFIICEGLSTGCSLYESTGHTVVVAFDAGNLLPVAEDLAKKITTDKIIICGDNDHSNETNKGAEMAEKAAKAIGCRVVLPVFQSPDGKGTTDFNDLCILEGVDVVKAQVVSAKRVEAETSIGDIEKQIAKIADLPLLQREVEIERLAKEHGITKGIIRAFLRGLQEDAAGNYSIVEDVEPWEDPVDGALLLDSIMDRLSSHVILHEGTVEPITAWVLFTYCYEAFRICPYLVLLSPEKRCGKTTCLEVLMGLVLKGLPSSNISPAGIYRTIEDCKPCLLVDEGEFLKDSKELQRILNSGHTKATSFVVRCEGEDLKPRKFSTRCPKCIALIGSSVTDTLDDRSIIVKLDRKSPREKVKSIGLNFDAECLEIRRKCKRWADDNLTALTLKRPTMPETDNDRMRDKWMPLFSIAEVAGGHWPELIKKSMLVVMKKIDEESIGVKLLEDIRAIFDDRYFDKIASDDLVEKLKELTESPWSDWNKGRGLTPNGLARLLRGFRVRSKTVRIGDTTKKGYDLDDFKYDFKRYLSPPPISNVTPSQTNNINNLEQKQSVTQSNDVTFKKPDNLLKLNDCYGVTFENPILGGKEEINSNDISKCHDCPACDKKTGICYAKSYFNGKPDSGVYCQDAVKTCERNVEQ